MSKKISDITTHSVRAQDIKFRHNLNVGDMYSILEVLSSLLRSSPPRGIADKTRDLRNKVDAAIEACISDFMKATFPDKDYDSAIIDLSTLDQADAEALRAKRIKLS